MNKLFIAETEDTPKVNFDAEKNIFEIVGRSLPEDATTFYQPIIKWLNQEITNFSGAFQLCFKLEYFNSSSAKQILQILSFLENAHLKGNNITAKWYFSESDELMEARGKEIKSLLKLPFEIIKF